MKRLVYGSEAEAAVAIGFDDFIADGVRGTSVWQKPSVSIFCAAGEQGKRAKEVFLKTAANFKFESYLENGVCQSIETLFDVECFDLINLLIRDLS